MSYDPTTGRFISQDPIAFESGDTNLYRYTGNDPTNETDPTGNDGTFTQSGMPAQAGEAIGTAIATGVASVVGTGMGLGPAASYTTAVLALGIVNAGTEAMESVIATVTVTTYNYSTLPMPPVPSRNLPVTQAPVDPGVIQARSPDFGLLLGHPGDPPEEATTLPTPPGMSYSSSGAVFNQQFYPKLSDQIVGGYHSETRRK